jgi:hypothetical protein
MYALEGGSHTALAGGGVGVPTAEREGKDDIRSIAYDVGGEEGGIGRCLLGEDGGDEHEVGFGRAVRCVIAAISARLPLSSNRRQEKQEENYHGHFYRRMITTMAFKSPWAYLY